ncbi:hypothetical protein HK101_001996 [Irineochytrium annulatum]|nr:hypothetical protein HK101_001996 [Irineochytrium annulatum]
MNREDVRKLAAENIKAISKTEELLPYFARDNGAVIKDLGKLLKDHPLIAHEAVSALVNLSSHDSLLPYMADDEFVINIILSIVFPKSIIADLSCMVLNNMTKSPTIAAKLIPDDTTPEPTTTSDENTPPTPQQPRTQYLDNLLEVFVRGSERLYNPSASYHFLAGVLANLSAHPRGARCLKARSRVDGVIRLAKVIPFTEHKDEHRRSGVVATIKNCCLDVTDPTRASANPTTVAEGGDFLLSEELNLLPYLLLPLCGPEEFDDDEMEGMPDELQLLEPGKRREPSAKVRLMLIESLLLLTHSRPGRDHLRAKRAYPVIKRMHLVEPDEGVRERAERLVDMLARDEADGSGGVVKGGAAAATAPAGPVDEAARKKKKVVVEELSDSDDDEGMPSIDPLIS